MSRADFDLADDTFTRTTRVHDWRNHVPGEVMDTWRMLTERERRLVAEVAEMAADAEEWP